MRDFLNGILAFIVAESLTDAEFASCTSTLPLYDQGTYDDLARILAARESVSDLGARLLAYYQARGVSVAQAKPTGSNIFLGSVLE